MSVKLFMRLCYLFLLARLTEVSSQCIDSESWIQRNGDSDRTCDWVAMKPDRRCSRAGKDPESSTPNKIVYASEACYETCGCPPTPAPTVLPDDYVCYNVANGHIKLRSKSLSDDDSLDDDTIVMENNTLVGVLEAGNVAVQTSGDSFVVEISMETADLVTYGLGDDDSFALGEGSVVISATLIKNFVGVDSIPDEITLTSFKVASMGDDYVQDEGYGAMSTNTIKFIFPDMDVGSYALHITFKCFTRIVITEEADLTTATLKIGDSLVSVTRVSATYSTCDVDKSTVRRLDETANPMFICAQESKTITAKSTIKFGYGNSGGSNSNYNVSAVFGEYSMSSISAEGGSLLVEATIESLDVLQIFPGDDDFNGRAEAHFGVSASLDDGCGEEVTINSSPVFRHMSGGEYELTGDDSTQDIRLERGGSNTATFYFKDVSACTYTLRLLFTAYTSVDSYGPIDAGAKMQVGNPVISVRSVADSDSSDCSFQNLGKMNTNSNWRRELLQEDGSKQDAIVCYSNETHVSLTAHAHWKDDDISSFPVFGLNTSTVTGFSNFGDVDINDGESLFVEVSMESLSYMEMDIYDDDSAAFGETAVQITARLTPRDGYTRSIIPVPSQYRVAGSKLTVYADDYTQNIGYARASNNKVKFYFNRPAAGEYNLRIHFGMQASAAFFNNDDGFVQLIFTDHMVVVGKSTEPRYSTECTQEVTQKYGKKNYGNGVGIPEYFLNVEK